MREVSADARARCRILQWLAAVLPIGLVAVSGCGGGGSMNAPSQNNNVSVSVACKPAAVVPQGTAQCSATVQGSANGTVTWLTSAGTISASGLFTAPASTGNVTITATSSQSTASTGTATVSVQLKTPPSKHVVMLMEENQEYSGVVGSAAWAHLNALISQGALATNYYADSHPSIGNYFMLTTGQLLTTDDNSTQVFTEDNIARRMLAGGVSFRVYAEGINQGYVGGNTGLYVIRHNPFAMLSDVAGSTQVANQTIWPFSQFLKDAASNALPEFSFIVPDVDDDAHSGTPQQADDWLEANVVGPLQGTQAFQAGGDGVLIVDFDEGADSDTAHGGGHVASVFWGPMVQPGYTQKSSSVYQHENMLRTVMDALGLQNPPGNAANAQAMAEFFLQQ